MYLCWAIDEALPEGVCVYVCVGMIDFPMILKHLYPHASYFVPHANAKDT